MTFSLAELRTASRSIFFFLSLFLADLSVHELCQKYYREKKRYNFGSQCDFGKKQNK